MSSDPDMRKSLAEVSDLMRQAGLDEAAVAAVAARWLAGSPSSTSPAGDDPAAERGAEMHAGGSVKHPNVRVRLSDIGADAGAIIRRVSYAMSDAGIEDAEIERYKDEVRAGGNAINVTRRWVQVAS
jgi:hypothetical protein